MKNHEKLRSIVPMPHKIIRGLLLKLFNTFYYLYCPIKDTIRQAIQTYNDVQCEICDFKGDMKDMYFCSKEEAEEMLKSMELLM